MKKKTQLKIFTLQPPLTAGDKKRANEKKARAKIRGQRTTYSNPLFPQNATNRRQVLPDIYMD